MKKLLSRSFLTILFLGLFVYFYAANPKTFSRMRDFGWKILLLTVVFQLLTLFINSVVIKLILEKLGTKINHVDSYYSSFLSSFGNYFLPLSGGLALRALYLKKNHDVSYKDFTAISYGQYIISFLCTSVLSLIALTVLYFKDGVFIPSLVILMAGLFLFTVSLSTHRFRLDNAMLRVFSRLTFGRAKGLTKKVYAVIDGWKQLLHTEGMVSILVLTTLLNIAVRAAFYFLAFRSLGVHTNIFYVIIFTMLISLSLYLTLTPASIGIREALLLLYSGHLSISTTNILSVNLLDRGSLFLILLAIFLLFQYVLNKPISVLIKKGTEGN